MDGMEVGVITDGMLLQRGNDVGASALLKDARLFADKFERGANTALDFGLRGRRCGLVDPADLPREHECERPCRPGVRLRSRPQVPSQLDGGM